MLLEYSIRLAIARRHHELHEKQKKINSRLSRVATGVTSRRFLAFALSYLHFVVVELVQLYRFRSYVRSAGRSMTAAAFRAHEHGET